MVYLIVGLYHCIAWHAFSSCDIVHWKVIIPYDCTCIPTFYIFPCSDITFDIVLVMLLTVSGPTNTNQKQLEIDHALNIDGFYFYFLIFCKF